jgi:hypothetical protein
MNACRIAGSIALVIGMGLTAFGGVLGRSAPEIDVSSASTAVALISGSLLVIRGRKTR